MVPGHPLSADADVYAVFTGSLQMHTVTRRKGSGFCCLFEPIPQLLTLSKVAHNPSQLCPVFRQVTVARHHSPRVDFDKLSQVRIR
jgi:hypothetical protein